MILKVNESFVEAEGCIYTDTDIDVFQSEFIKEIKETISLAIRACDKAGLNFVEILKEVEA